MARLSRILFLTLIAASLANAQPTRYLWKDGYDQAQAIVNRIRPPDGYKRVELSRGTFADWLRNLPLKQDRVSVYLFNGNLKSNQSAHFAVIDMDTGRKDLQQCGDAIIRLRAEYLYSIGDYGSIHFNFTSGDKADFTEWIKGYRPIVKNNKVRWVRTAGEDSSYPNFRKYLEKVFEYAGTLSLSKELVKINNIADMQTGDVFIRGGAPGHAATVIDMAERSDSGKKIFLLAQSYMPAQDIYILKNPNDSAISPWYELDFGEELVTPEWIFHKDDLKRFPKER